MNPDAPPPPTQTLTTAIAGGSAYGRLPGVPALEVGMATDPGRDPNKQVNEDALLARDTQHGHLAVVCDGMGGHVGGREASHLAIETIFRVADAMPAGTPPQQVLGEALRQANAAIYARGQQSPELKGMGSTCVAVLTHPGGSDVAHVGDSRVYLLTQGQVYQVTKDHSLVQRLVDANMLTPEQAANHPNANQITNAFGQRPDCEVELRPQPLPHGPGDTFLLCSDGLSDEVGPQDILHILAPHPTCDDAARQLIDLANARGGHDNITVIIVRLAGGAPFAVSHPPANAAAQAVSSTQTAEMEILQPAHIAAAGAAAAAAASSTLAMPASAVLPPSSPHPAAGAPPPFTPPPAYGSTPTPIEPAQKKSSKGLVIGVVVVLLLVVVGVAASVVLRNKQQDPSVSPSTSASDDDDVPPVPSTPKSVKPIATPTDEPIPSGSNPRPHASGKTPSGTATATATGTVIAPGATIKILPQMPTAPSPTVKQE